MTDKWIGFDRRVEPLWLNFIVEMLKEGKSEEDIRKLLREKLTLHIKGAEAVNKTVTVMMRLFFSLPEALRDIFFKGFSLSYGVEEEERIWIYWGLLLLRYPFVKDVADITGRFLEFQGSVSTKEIQEKILNTWGDRSTVKRVVQMVTKTMEDFGFIMRVKTRPFTVFEKLPCKKTENPELMQWFLEVLLNLEDMNFIPFEAIYKRYYAFPFRISLMPAGENKSIKVIRDGIYEMAGIKRDTLPYKVFTEERFSREEGLELFKLDFLKLGILADNFRRQKHRHNYVGFVVDRNITFTNICEARCNFCAFWRQEDHPEAFLLSIDEILEKVKELKDVGGTQVMLQGGLRCDLDFYKNMLKAIKSEYPEITLHSLSPAEVYYLSQKHDLSIKEILLQLRDAGLDSLPGAAEILADRVRNKVSPGKLKTDDWLSVMRTCGEIGMGSTATMTFGMGETLEERIEHLMRLRELQDETGVFRAFIPWTFSPDNTKMPYIERADTEDYLRMVAISRLMLDNFDHIHAGWVTEGLDVASLALGMGADDMGGILMEEVVVKATGIENRVTADDLIRVIKGAGKIPVKRNTAYEILHIY